MPRDDNVLQGFLGAALVIGLFFFSLTKVNAMAEERIQKQAIDLGYGRWELDPGTKNIQFVWFEPYYTEAPTVIEQTTSEQETKSKVR